jgi:predicted branched-subunit amino acid permease
VNSHNLQSETAMNAPAPVSRFMEGFRSLAPLWVGAIPIGCAYAIAARDAGLSVVETQLMSMTIFSAGLQVSAVALLQTGASGLLLLATAAVLNLHQVLLGFSLGQRLRLTPAERWIAAYFLNDGAYGATMANGAPSFAFLLGAELSMFVVWNAATLFGALAGPYIPDPTRLGVDFVFPLLFLALLIPLLRSRTDLLVASGAGALAAIVSHVGSTSSAVLAAVVSASVIGAWWTRAEPRQEQRQ